MIARGVTLDQLHQAAREVGVRFSMGTPDERATRKGPEFRFTLKTDTERFGYPDKQGNGGAPWRRKSQYPRASGRYATVPGACCFHGHEQFFRALYRLAPGAWIKTAKAIYISPEQFEATFRAAGYNPNAGNGLRGPIPYDQACVCNGGFD